VSLATENLGVLVAVTGSYAGAGIQYLIPVALVFAARRRLAVLRQRTRLALDNPSQSVFRHGVFLVFIVAWSTVAVGLVSANFILRAIDDD